MGGSCLQPGAAGVQDRAVLTCPSIRGEIDPAKPGLAFGLEEDMQWRAQKFIKH
jgi:hypothetical protein